MKEYYVGLSNERVSLEPLTVVHIKDLSRIGGDPTIWKWFSADLSKAKDLESWMTSRLEESNIGDKMSYAVLTDDKIAGSTSYGHIDWREKVMEIGWTWLSGEFIGSGINKHMKFLMLSHAFDVMDVKRVEIRTDEINVRSRRAIEKIGAQLDGILRSHRMTQGARRRNTAVYSIIEEDWEGIRSTIFKDL